jgi:hypothetical protein
MRTCIVFFLRVKNFPGVGKWDMGNNSGTIIPLNGKNNRTTL